jgi:hypothetical protein
MIIHRFSDEKKKGYYTCCWPWMKTEVKGLSVDEN